MEHSFSVTDRHKDLSLFPILAECGFWLGVCGCRR